MFLPPIRLRGVNQPPLHAYQGKCPAVRRLTAEHLLLVVVLTGGMIHPRAVGVRMVETLLIGSALLSMIAGIAAIIAFSHGLSVIVWPLVQVVLLTSGVVFVCACVLKVIGRQVW